MNILPIKKTSLEVKILLPLIILQGIVVVILVYWLSYLNQHQEHFKRHTQAIEKVNGYAIEIQELQKSIDTNLLAYRFDNDETHLENMRKQDKLTRDILDDMSGVSSTPELKDLVSEFLSSRQGFEEIKEDLVLAINQKNFELIDTNFRRWMVKSQRIDAALAKLIDNNVEILKQSSLQHQSIIGGMFNLSLGIIMGTVLIVVFLYFYLRMTVTRPISKLSQAAYKISRGKFDSVFKYRSDDEIGQLSVDLNRMSKKLKRYYKYLEEEVKQKEKEIKKSKEIENRKDDFISMASHELKTPLTSIKILTQLLIKKSEKQKDDVTKQYLVKVNGQIDRLSDIVSDLLDVSRIRIGRLRLNKESFDIGKLVAEAAEDVERSSKKHIIEVNSDVSKLIRADKDRISQVLINLFSNAIKYSPNANRVVARVESGSQEVIISVKDFGVGIEKEHHKKIFGRFYRVYDDKDKTFPGLGMGLHIAGDIVKRHGGKIWVKSQPGKGSTFYFTLPYGQKKNTDS